MLATAFAGAVAVKHLAIVDEAAKAIESLQGVDEEAVLAAFNDRLVHAAVEFEKLRVLYRPDAAVYEPFLLLPAAQECRAVELETRFQQSGRFDQQAKPITVLVSLQRSQDRQESSAVAGQALDPAPISHAQQDLRQATLGEVVAPQEFALGDPFRQPVM